MSQQKRFAKIFGIYVGSSVLNRALPFLLLPIMTKYLSPAEYGFLAVYQALISFALPFIGMNMQNNITRNMFKASKDTVAKIVSNMLCVLTATTTLSFLGLSLYLIFADSLSGIPQRWLYAIPFVTFTTMINQFNLTILRNQGRALPYGAYEVLNTALNLALSVVLVMIYRWGWEGRAFALVASSAVFGLISLAHLLRSGFLRFDINRATVREIVKISAPLVVYSLGGIIIFLSDRLFIDRMVGKTAVGIYAVAYSFGMLINLVTESFNKTWSPWVYARLADITDIKRTEIVRFTYAYNIGLILLALVLTAASHVLIHFMTHPKYHEAKDLIIWIMLANAVNGMYATLVPYSVHQGKTGFLAVIMGVAALVNLIGNYLLIPLHGALGAAHATLLAYAVSYLGNWWYVNRTYPMPWFKKDTFILPNGSFALFRPFALKSHETV